MDSERLYEQGELLYEQKRYQEALEVFTAAYNATTDVIEKSECLNYMGCCHIGLHNYDKALHLFDDAIQFSPDWERLYFNK